MSIFRVGIHKMALLSTIAGILSEQGAPYYMANCIDRVFVQNPADMKREIFCLAAAAVTVTAGGLMLAFNKSIDSTGKLIGLWLASPAWIGGFFTAATYETLAHHTSDAGFYAAPAGAGIFLTALSLVLARPDADGGKVKTTLQYRQ